MHYGKNYGLGIALMCAVGCGASGTSDDSGGDKQRASLALKERDLNGCIVSVRTVCADDKLSLEACKNLVQAKCEWSEPPPPPPEFDCVAAVQEACGDGKLSDVDCDAAVRLRCEATPVDPSESDCLLQVKEFANEQKLSREEAEALSHAKCGATAEPESSCDAKAAEGCSVRGLAGQKCEQLIEDVCTEQSGGAEPGKEEPSKEDPKGCEALPCEIESRKACESRELDAWTCKELIAKVCWDEVDTSPQEPVDPAPLACELDAGKRCELGKLDALACKELVAKTCWGAADASEEPSREEPTKQPTK